MRVALFSDIHGNTPGLQAILAHLDSQGGADMLFSLGDMLGGGPGTDEVIELLLKRNVQMIRDNHEEMFTDWEAWINKIPEKWFDWAQRTIAWMRTYLSQPYWELLRYLPKSATTNLGDGYQLFVCHAAPDDPWAYVCAQDVSRNVLRATFGSIDADLIAYGHMHQHHVLWMDAKLLVNVASVGLRSDGLSAYTLVENTDNRWVVRQFQVPYDTVEEARLTQLRSVPLP